MREVQARTLAELEQQRSATSQAREEAARLKGQIEALEAKAKPKAGAKQ
jgi:BMFP domain-containing protein YqiC